MTIYIIKVYNMNDDIEMHRPMQWMNERSVWEIRKQWALFDSSWTP